MLTKRSNSFLEIPPGLFSATDIFALFCAGQNKLAKLILFLKDKVLQKTKAPVCTVTQLGGNSRRLELGLRQDSNSQNPNRQYELNNPSLPPSQGLVGINLEKL